MTQPAIITRDESLTPEQEAYLSRLLECDSVRVSKPMGQYFLIKETKRHTSEGGVTAWIRDGEPFDFEFLESRCVARGETIEAMIADAERYQRISKMSWVEVLAEPELMRGTLKVDGGGVAG